MGDDVGLPEGAVDGLVEGRVVGRSVGTGVGAAEGDVDGASVGERVGGVVGSGAVGGGVGGGVGGFSQQIVNVGQPMLQLTLPPGQTPLATEVSCQIDSQPYKRRRRRATLRRRERSRVVNDSNSSCDMAGTFGLECFLSCDRSCEASDNDGPIRITRSMKMPASLKQRRLERQQQESPIDHVVCFIEGLYLI